MTIFLLLFLILILIILINLFKKKNNLLSYEYIKKFPKILLHDHLDGGIRPSTMIEIAKELNYPLPSYDLIKLQKWLLNNSHTGSLKNFLKPFDYILPLLQREKDLIRIAEEVVLDLEKDGVIYGELRLLPDAHTKNGLSYHQIINSILLGIKKGEKKSKNGIKINLILCANRTLNNALEIAQLTKEYFKKGVIGFDLVGLEGDNDIIKHAPAFKFLQNNDIPFVIHAGEQNIQSLKNALQFNPNRIGHGIKMLEDINKNKHIIRFILNNNIHLELCPTSNIRSGSFKDIDTFPLSFLLNNGFNFSINTDDRTLIGKTFSNEINDLAKKNNLTKKDLLKLMLNTVNNSFISLQNKVKLKEKILDFFNHS